MKNLKIYLALFLLLNLSASAQIFYPNGPLVDSELTFTFKPGDTLAKLFPEYSGNWVAIDTTGAHLWQMGNTLKTVFSNDTLSSFGLMTDTLLPYPPGANYWFTLDMTHQVANFIVDIWHKYQTDSGHAGGIIEFSFDSGATWLNVVACVSPYEQNMYAATDTLFSGDAAFTGNSHGEQLSRFQFLNCIGVSPVTSCSFMSYLGMPTSLRFRFLSDATHDSLSGWMIDSIKVEGPGCIPGLVKAAPAADHFGISPNPSSGSVSITCPAAANAAAQLIIYNEVGAPVYQCATTGSTVVNTESWPRGLYFVKMELDGATFPVQKLVVE